MATAILLAGFSIASDGEFAIKGFLGCVFFFCLAYDIITLIK